MGLLFSGSHRLTELPAYWSDCLISTHTIRLTYLQSDEARDLITQPVPNFPDIYESAAVEAIVNLTHGQPYLVQLACSCLVDRLNQEYRQTQTRRKVTAEDVQAIIPTLFERAEGFFNEFWQTLSGHQKSALHTIVLQQPLTSINAATFKNLIEAEILEERNSTYVFQVPLMCEYVKTLVSSDEEIDSNFKLT